jgi:PEGA domain
MKSRFGSSRWVRTSLFIMAATSMSFTPVCASGQTPTAEPAVEDARARAAARKKVGDEAMEALRFADALQAYNDAYAVTNNVALLYNMGRALEALNRFPEALEKLTAFDASASADLKARVPRLSQLIADLRKRVATLVIQTNVEGARIYVRNVVVGKSPLTQPLALVAGSAEIEIDAEGYFPAKKTLDLEGGSEQTVSFDLFSRATTGVLVVRASEKAAEVLIDGKRIGLAPIELNVQQGAHKIAVRHPDFRTYETSAIVPAGSSKTVTAQLQNKSVATKWWFWTGVGAVVATGAVVTYAAVTERAPDAGTIAPGVVSTESFGMTAPVLVHF